MLPFAVKREQIVELVDLLLRKRLTILPPEVKIRLTFRAAPHARDYWASDGPKRRFKGGQGDALLSGGLTKCFFRRLLLLIRRPRNLPLDHLEPAFNIFYFNRGKGVRPSYNYLTPVVQRVDFVSHNRTSRGLL